jgi:hypothetical protein
MSALPLKEFPAYYRTRNFSLLMEYILGQMNTEHKLISHSFSANYNIILPYMPGLPSFTTKNSYSFLISSDPVYIKILEFCVKIGNSVCDLNNEYYNNNYAYISKSCTECGTNSDSDYSAFSVSENKTISNGLSYSQVQYK